MTDIHRNHPRPRFAPAATALALGLTSAAVVGGAPVAADPAPAPQPVEIATTGSYSGTVPDGVCAVRSTVLGAAGGHNMSSSGESASGANGGGASITSVYTVAPGMRYEGTVGGGGDQGSVRDGDAGSGGSNGGGPGGSVVGDIHPGAGGGGWTDLQLGGTLVVLAGGGGGSGGGHSLNDGVGGDAGIPTAAGVTPGSDGLDGRQKSGATVGGGGAGGTDASGTGGVNAGEPTLNGTAGNGRAGGAGGADRTPDAGGGGGGGYFGGGGGASTVSAHGGGPPVVDGVAGAGGGGGASYVAATSPDGSDSPVDLVGTAVGERLDTAGDGADGAVTLEWIPCDYDLTVEKSVSPATAQVGDTVTWTVTVRNTGPRPMTRGDTVTLTDTLPGSGPRTINSISVDLQDTGPVPGAPLDRTGMTCGAASGDPMPAALECSRPYAASASPGAPSGGERGLDVGESVTVRYSEVATSAGSSTNIASVTDRATGDSDDTASATVDVAVAPPAADPDTTTGPQGEPQSVDPLANDAAGSSSAPLDPSTLTLVDAGGEPAASVTAPGQGTYAIEDGRIVFTPLPDFTGTADPVTYRVADANGRSATAVYTPIVLAGLTEDVGEVTEQAPTGVVVTLDPVADAPGLVPSTVRLVGAGGKEVTTLTVADEGTWQVDLSTGQVTFTPVAGFTGDPDLVRFAGSTDDGTAVVGRLIVNYLQRAGAAGTPGMPGSPASGGSGSPLAATGPASVALSLNVAGLLIATGTAVLFLGRRRRFDSA
ncbi:MAG: Ig-like domain-containing protein [Dermatophilaceae bacterium]